MLAYPEIETVNTHDVLIVNAGKRVFEVKNRVIKITQPAGWDLAPTVPAGLAAAANGYDTLTITWSASTD